MAEALLPLRVVILHGAHGGPDTNWFPWLHAALEDVGIDVLRPRFPTPSGQSLSAWLDVYDRAAGGLPVAPTVLVGHSLGAAFALRLAGRVERVAGIFLAAGFVGALGLPDYDGINQSFFAAPFDWPAIRGRTRGAVRCWAGDDDPYVPLARSQDLANGLGAPLEVVPGGRHLSGETGFTTFPQLRDAILAVAAGQGGGSRRRVAGGLGAGAGRCEGRGDQTMSERAPKVSSEEETALSRANSVQPGTPAGSVPQSDPSPVPPPNAEQPK